uniref:Lipase n=1 Tax=Pseudomonas fluorescens TaxID=294 RepID=LIPA_PSEFL|nr:RecName: Full=Lipase; AltName: Full=Triacylglycerol lipase; Flags: Precursor [Pseudomonas fluorescens]AAC60402.1 lipase [Pseudomonas fluorescens]BAA02012.1 triacylglycerol lipase [Pseudomonas fluorescens]
MGVFDYKNLGTEASKTLFADATAITLYTYHNLDNGFAVGYQQHGLGLGCRHTGRGVARQHRLPGSDPPAFPGILTRKRPPWTRCTQPVGRQSSASALGYGGKVDARGTFFGEKAGYTTAQAEVLGKYDDAGKLLEIGIGFRGTSGPRESLITTPCRSGQRPARRAGPQGLCEKLCRRTFGGLLKTVADYAGAHGLSGKDVLVSGHSLGGLAVNSMADLSTSKWAGFYKDANYLAYASPTQSAGDKVLNIGYENDPVFRALDGSTFNLSSLGVHDKAHESTTDNIVSFNDHYASTLWNVLPFSIANLSTWVSHLPSAYGDGMTRVLESGFYEQMTRDSTIILCPTWSDPARANTWVQDLNRNAEPHTGNTFIIGSDGNDLIQGGKGADFIEGGKGNDTIRDNSGHNTFLFSGHFGQDRIIGYQPTGWCSRAPTAAPTCATTRRPWGPIRC